MSSPSSSPYKQVPPRPHTSVKDIGFSEDRNARFRRTMEDGHCMIDGFGNSPTDALFAIYDGHGGRAVMSIVESCFHQHLARILSAKSEYSTVVSERGQLTESMVEQVLNETYRATDESTKEISFGGSTAVTCLILQLSDNTENNSKNNSENQENNIRRVLFSANCGDARAVISHNWTAQRLTVDHKATDVDEIKRITDKGGCVINGRVGAFLAVSRSFGNNTLKEYVISEPYQSRVTLTPEHNILILACDGLWDVMDDQQAVDFCREIIVKQEEETTTTPKSSSEEENGEKTEQQQESIAQICAQRLLERAKELRSTDNLSIMVVIL